MQGHNGAGRGSRPRGDAGAEGECELFDDASARFFLCCLCRQQVLICSHCDRGQIYCAGDCRGYGRRMRRREAASRYQRSRQGRFNHAARSRRYRARQKIVTHQGSPGLAPDACVPEVSTATQERTPPGARAAALNSTRARAQRADVTFGRHCHWCGQACSPFVRRDHLRRRRAARFDPP